MFSGVDILFYSLAVIALVTAVGVITAKNPVYSALSLILTLFSMAGLFLLLRAEFLAVVQVLTYAGAILVLFVFIVMLLNLSKDELFEKGFSNLGKILLTLVSVVLFVTLSFMTQFAKISPAAVDDSFGSIQMVGREIFTKYIIPFEIAGVLLTVALIGAVLLAKRDLVLKEK